MAAVGVAEGLVILIIAVARVADVAILAAVDVVVDLLLFVLLFVLLFFTDSLINQATVDICDAADCSPGGNRTVGGIDNAVVRIDISAAARWALG